LTAPQSKLDTDALLVLIQPNQRGAFMCRSSRIDSGTAVAPLALPAIGTDVACKNRSMTMMPVRMKPIRLEPLPNRRRFIVAWLGDQEIFTEEAIKWLSEL